MTEGAPERQSELIREVVREGEAYLAAQVTLATSADQRASVMASVFTAAGAAIVAGLIAFVADSDRVAGANAIMWGGGVAAILFLFSAGLCVWATLPVGFDLPGSQPDSWREELEHGTDLDVALREQAQNYQDKITDNRRVLKTNANKFKWGAIAGITAPIGGSLVWAFISFYLSI